MFDYAAGKADWAVSGQPMEGRTAGRRRAIDVARTDVATFAPDQSLREVRAEMAGGDTDFCLIVDPRGVLLGRIDGEPAEADPNARAGDVMRLAPGTVKPETFLHDLVDGLRDSRFKRTIVTAREPEEAGRLVGVLFLADVERVLAENERL